MEKIFCWEPSFVRYVRRWQIQKVTEGHSGKWQAETANADHVLAWLKVALSDWLREKNTIYWLEKYGL